jgi:tight adherence protein B
MLAERNQSFASETAADNYIYEASEPADSLENLLRLEQRIQSGENSRSVLNGLQWADGVLTQQLRFGISCGIPLSPLITWLRTEYQQSQMQERRAEIALRNPVLTSRFVHWLPWASLAGAQAMGLPAISVLVLQPVGWAVIAGALVLNLFSVRMTRRITRAATHVPANFAWQYRLLAMAVRHGVGIRFALAELDLAADFLEPKLEGWVNESLASGLPLAGLLELQATALTNRIEQQRNLLAEELPVKLLLPMALFLLPQFMLLLVVPQVLAAFGLFK